MASAIEKKVFEVGDKIAEKLNLSIVDAEYKKEDNGKVLRIYIDAENGAGLDECEKFSRAFDEEFDVLDIITEAYTLEISSPGVDRVLKTEREFNHYIGREVEVKLYKAINGKKEFMGTLKDYNENTATIACDNEDILIPIKEAVYIRLYFKM